MTRFDAWYENKLGSRLTKGLRPHEPTIPDNFESQKHVDIEEYLEIYSYILSPGLAKLQTFCIPVAKLVGAEKAVCIRGYVLWPWTVFLTNF